MLKSTFTNTFIYKICLMHGNQTTCVYAFIYVRMYVHKCYSVHCSIFYGSFFYTHVMLRLWKYVHYTHLVISFCFSCYKLNMNVNFIVQFYLHATPSYRYERRWRQQRRHVCACVCVCFSFIRFLFLLLYFCFSSPFLYALFSLLWLAGWLHMQVYCRGL